MAGWIGVSAFNVAEYCFGLFCWSGTVVEFVMELRLAVQRDLWIFLGAGSAILSNRCDRGWFDDRLESLGPRNPFKRSI